VFKKASIKLASEFSKRSLSGKKEEVSPSLSMILSKYIKNASAFYLCDKNGADPSEAYNAVGGKRRISLQLFPSHPKLPKNETGVPLTLHLTMVAHYDGSLTVPVRDYHSMVVLIDQVRLDVGKVQQETGTENGAARRHVTAYAFGFTSDTSKTMELRYRSPFLAPRDIQSKEEDVRLVDFLLLHPSQNERDLKVLDYVTNPTSACIVSSGCKVGNKKRIGNRAVLVSRFKTRVDGLCKASYKCQLVLGLIRRYNTGEVEVERCERPLDLASILNQEYYPDKVRAMTFSRGEFMWFRLRRRCFVAPEECRSGLLLPYDYDNSGVEISDVVNDEDRVLLSTGNVKHLRVEDATSMVAKEDGTTQLCDENSTTSRLTKYSPNSGYSRPDASQHAAVSVVSIVREKEQVVEKPVPRITDSIMTSYNNYEDNSYAPVENEKEMAATDLTTGTVKGGPRRDWDRMCVTPPASNNLSPVAVQRAMANPFACVSNASETSRVHSLVMKSNTPAGVEQKYLFEEKPNMSERDENHSKEEATKKNVGLITFEITFQREGADSEFTE
ncbi:hypothetical protein TraAM80_08321, partial [Trypanosoma rangeli]